MGECQMKKRHKRIRNITVALTVFSVCGLFVYAQKVKEIIRDVERQIEMEQIAVEEKNMQLAEIKQQSETMDSPEYVKKVATEELGMVEEDTIVFKAKE